ncbi:hypothetical protein AAAV48_13575, partial [Agathobaculum butyriciproducens]
IYSIPYSVAQSLERDFKNYYFIIQGLDYLCPASYLIDRFGEVAQPIFSKIFVLNKQCAMAQEARDRLLPKLMSGELEV